MPDFWMDVDAALSEVPVNILPLIDDTDFKSREVSIAYNASGMDLVWNFVTPGGAFTQTAVTPTTGGNYDWTHQGDGIYTIEIPASGGASINNNTEGFGWFSGFVTGVLPWRGPTIGFRASGLNDLLIESAYSTTRGLAGTALPAAAADAAGGLPISDAGGLDMDAILVDTGTTIPGILGTPAGASMSADIAAIEAQTDDIGTAGAGLTAVPWNAAWDAEVQSEATDALNAYDPPTRAELTTDTNSILSKLLKYFQLAMRSDAAITTDNATELTAINADGGSGAGDYAATTDSLEALADAGSGGDGSSFTAIPWNAAWDAEVESEVTDALNAYDPPTRAELTTDTNSILSKVLKYFQLAMRSDAAITTDNATELTAINADGGSGAGDYAATTDSLEANRDNIGSPAGASVSADIAAIEAQTDDIGVAGAGLTAVPWNAAWDAEVESEATDALNAYDPPTRAELTTDTNSILSKLLKYVQLLTRSDTAITTDNATELTAINADGGSGAGDYAATTDSLEANRDNIGTTGAALTLGTTLLNKIADHTIRRSFVNAADSADGDTKSFRSLLGAIGKLVNRVAISGSTLTVYEEDDSTALGTQTITTSASADPITQVNTD